MKRTAMLAIVLSVVGASGAFAQKATERYSTTYFTEVKTLNYFLLLDSTAQRVAANTQDGLVENDRYGRFVPSLAES